MARYSYSFLRLVLPALRVLCGLTSSISRDAALLVGGIQPPPHILGQENIPANAPFALVLNHYDRPGLGAWWGAAVVVHAVACRRASEPRGMHIAITREWWYAGGFGRAVKQPLTRWLFGRLARAYGFVLLPPVVQGESFRGEGALSVRRVLALTRCASPRIVAIAPEGRTGEHGNLCEPPKGAGLFLLALTRNTIPCLPTGVYEDQEGILTISFGKPFLLCADRFMPREQQDRQAAAQVMVNIGKLLPETMWGTYHAEIKKNRGEAFL